MVEQLSVGLWIVHPDEPHVATVSQAWTVAAPYSHSRPERVHAVFAVGATVGQGLAPASAQPASQRAPLLLPPELPAPLDPPLPLELDPPPELLAPLELAPLLDAEPELEPAPELLELLEPPPLLPALPSSPPPPSPGAPVNVAPPHATTAPRAPPKTIQRVRFILWSVGHPRAICEEDSIAGRVG